MKKILLSIVCGFFLLTGCTANNVTTSMYTGEFQQQELCVLPTEFVNGNNSFGIKAVKLLQKNDKNIAISPVSLQLALLMTRAGAIGQTAEEMSDALGMEELSDVDIIGACKQLMSRANTDGMVCANSIWLNKDITFDQDFLDICTKDFMADASVVDFSKSKTTKIINEWASEKTHGKIKNLNEEPLSKDTVMVLMNALYYLGAWVSPFKHDDTWDDTFHTPSGDKNVPMMHDDKNVKYYNDKFQMISLPFKDSDFSMAFILPKEGNDINELLTTMENINFSDIYSSMEKNLIDINLPKFEYHFGESFIDTLKVLGMNEAFGVGAQFDNITGGESEIFLSKVIQKCYIRVDELGAEAAAVTESCPEATCMPMEPPQFHANHPFTFAICSEADSTILFMGIVNNPLEK
jgi:serine protease inhibitor